MPTLKYLEEGWAVRGKHRLTIELPVRLWAQIQDLAGDNGLHPSELIRRYLALAVERAEKK